MSANEIIDLWRTKTSPDWAYFDKFEAEENLSPFWRRETLFRQWFAELDLTSVLEIACGKGRHAAVCAELCGSLAIVDTSVDAVEACRSRFRLRPNVHVHLSTDGATLPFLADSSVTAVYSYDAMVHFEVETIASYLREIGRVLGPGGRALLHHSNNSAEPAKSVTESTGWRNYMTQELMGHLAARAGLRAVKTQVIPWSTATSDAVSLLEHP